MRLAFLSPFLYENSKGEFLWQIWYVDMFLGKYLLLYCKLGKPLAQSGGSCLSVTTFQNSFLISSNVPWFILNLRGKKLWTSY